MRRYVEAPAEERKDLTEGYEFLEAGDPESAYQFFHSRYAAGNKEAAEALRSARRGQLRAELAEVPDWKQYRKVLEFVNQHTAYVPREARGIPNPQSDPRVAAAIEKARAAPTPAHYVSLGNWLESVGDYPGAFEAAALALQQDPQNPKAHHLMGELFEAAGHEWSARALYTHGLFLPGKAEDHYVFHYDLYFLSASAEDGTVKPEQALHADSSIHRESMRSEHDTGHCPLLKKLAQQRESRLRMPVSSDRNL